MKQRSVFLSLFLVAVIVVAACGGDEKKEETWLGTPPPDGSTAAEDAATSTDTATHPASPGGAALVPEVAAGSTVIIMLETNSIGAPENGIPVGPSVLTVQNVSADVHNLFIEGPGMQVAAGDPIAAGGSRNVEATFQPGTYTFYCPIADHRTKGEEIQVTVTE